MSGVAPGLSHPALAPLAGAAPGEAPLTDRRRLATLLEGVALLGHLERRGWSLTRGWSGARVAPDGRLGNVDAGGGADPELPQRRAADLLLLLFRGAGSVAGRGAARRAARALLDRWRQNLEPVPPDALVGQLLAEAPFLWGAPYAAARAALAAELGGELWVTGPRGFRRRLLRRCTKLSALRSLLAGGDAARWWSGGGSQARDPVALAAEGRWRPAAAAWAAAPPTSPEGRYEMARALHAVGRFDAAKRALRGLRRPAARALLLECRLPLGELAAAKRSLAGWARDPSAEEHLATLAAVASRLHASLGDPDAARPWIDRALASRDPRVRLEAAIVAGEAAWDRGDPAAVERWIEASAAARERPDLAWRWLHLRALQGMARRDGTAVARHVSAALGGRRRLRPSDAAGLWNDLAVGRAMAGDLAGAERALRHVVRLSDGSEGNRRTTLALCNLAEIRLRRGRLRGVRDVIEQSERANAAAGNWRGWAQDRELGVRYQLARGRSGSAAALAEETLKALAARRLGERRGPLRVLAGRAYGWLGEVAAAREALAETTREERAELEPEERPALWALAGDRERAHAENPEGSCRRFWRQVLGDEETVEWAALETLEPYRAARLVFDVERLAPGRTPREWLRRAAASLREAGAEALALRLGARDPGPWPVLESYLEPAARRAAAERLAALVAEVSPEARLAWRDAESEVELVSGAGGRQRLERPLDGGTLCLEASQLGARERVVFALACRDLPPLRAPGAGPRRPRHGIVGRSPALKSAIDRLSRLAPRDLPVLVLGETGTGKELAARLVHAESRRSDRPFLPINCGALAGSLLLSELFGHVRGAFTGADRDRSGIFETARGGTVFLDEIGDLPLAAQAKLLRVLQEGEVRRVGESVARRIDVRIVAATHRDLAAMAARGEFRHDLLYRLKVGRVELPPLRERARDLFELADHFLAAEGPGDPPRLSAAARAALEAHTWPGNVRELENVLLVAVALAEGGRLEPEHLDLPRRPPARRCGYHQQVDALRHRLLAEALAATSGNRAAAARRLGLSRQALSYLIRRLGIDPPERPPTR